VADPFNLQRFVEAQNPVYDHVRLELQRGQKTGHWMWFIFPQIQGLGHSSMAEKYAVASLKEAQAYLEHSILGPRLVECTELMLQISGKTLAEILGYPDNFKFKSCMTLFNRANPRQDVFQKALKKFCGGEEDAKTIERLGPSR